MKKLLSLLLFLVISKTSFSQSVPVVAPMAKTDYLKKSKKQKTAAWLLLSGGILMATGGYIFFVYEGLRGDGIGSTKSKIAVSMFYAGGFSILGSIPLFIAAARNKGISMSASIGLKMEKMPVISQTFFVQTSYPAVSIKFNLK